MSFFELEIILFDVNSLHAIQIIWCDHDLLRILISIVRVILYMWIVFVLQFGCLVIPGYLLTVAMSGPNDFLLLFYALKMNVVLRFYSCLLYVYCVLFSMIY